MDDLDLAPTTTAAPERRELPEFTLKNVALDIVHGLQALVLNPEASKVVAPIVFFAESIGTKVIRKKVPYTEIDYSSYMQQIEKIEEGELNYYKIAGDTGPIVYPAGHVNIYSWMKWITEGLDDLELGQRVFGYLYLATLVLTITTYFSASNGSVPPWVLYLLACSKRLHSIYVLRLFNDCWTTFCMVGTVLLLQQASYWKSTSGFLSGVITYAAADMYSMAVSIKLNALLYLPAVLYILYLLSDECLLLFLGPVVFGLLVQIGIGWNFLLPLASDPEAHEIRWAYLSQAYDFKRQFLYEWTVNWKAVSEETFSSSWFHILLLVVHVGLLSLFVLTRWLTPETLGKSRIQFFKDIFLFWKRSATAKSIINDHVLGPKFVFMTMTITNIVGVFCARSLHYQFLSWYCYSLPFLLWQTNLPFYVAIPMYGIHEYCWNVFPATELSSSGLLTVLNLTLAGVWLNDQQFSKVVEKKDD
ncbi:unnamed protein product [Kuraishia capsulata CBS 1993]|uniref:Dol-P-Man:Man(5)GlcNAc(2)-PP-Dol alpha-1,3-mannosyltransferase n=1 Tax=Kuraishia capsulata CBS 1993 TaxID=1382522 RepID=W6MG21_9ASCO|nr:uncharacterized protein KUCA_T00000612001 [Kuraishia capsulata CBS 1993]CDK24646.1 unnamed protein product [Kuraishia capsulata CBS 1993]